MTLRPLSFTRLWDQADSGSSDSRKRFQDAPRDASSTWRSRQIPQWKTFLTLNIWRRWRRNVSVKKKSIEEALNFTIRERVGDLFSTIDGKMLQTIIKYSHGQEWPPHSSLRELLQQHCVELGWSVLWEPHIDVDGKKHSHLKAGHSLRGQRLYCYWVPDVPTLTSPSNLRHSLGLESWEIQHASHWLVYPHVLQRCKRPSCSGHLEPWLLVQEERRTAQTSQSETYMSFDRWNRQYASGGSS